MEDRKFKTLIEHKQVDLIPYIKEYLVQYPETQILIGCDSQNKKRESTYALIIALRRPGKGSHVLFCRYGVPRIRENRDRLIKETWDSIELAEHILTNVGVRATWIDIDINADEKFGSNIVLAESVGMCTGMGYKVRYKHHPTDTPIVTYCADQVCR